MISITVFLLILFGSDRADTQDVPAPQAPPTLQLGIDRLNTVLAAGDTAAGLADAVAPAIVSFVEEEVDVEHLADRTFDDYCRDHVEDYEDELDADQLANQIESCNERLQRAFSRRLQEDLLARVRDAGIRHIGVSDLAIEDDGGQLWATIDGRAGKSALTCRLGRREQRWVIVDLEIDGVELSDHYEELLEDILDEGYSLPVLLARLDGRDYIILEDFSTTTPGRLPRDWSHTRDKDKHKPKPYKVEAANGYRYLAAQDTGKSVIIGKFVHWNPRKYPIMTWCWRVNALPSGADERINHLNDSAAGIYVIFSQNWLGVPKQIKYVWSSTLAEGTVDRRNKPFRPWFFVLESGDANLGKWTFEQVDLMRDYRRVFGGGKPKKRSIGLGLLTDANNTDSYAEAYYADFRAWSREALERGLVVDHCDCFDTAAGGSDSTETLSQLDGERSGDLQ